VAPFEDILYCFVAARNPALRRLLVNPEARLELESKANAYNIKIWGRAVPGRNVMAHRRRSELLHWVPEAQDPRSVLAVPLWPERIEYKTGDEFYQGQTPLGRSRKSQRLLWLELAFQGLLPAVGFALVAMWFWIAYAGNGEALWQLYSLSISCLAILGLQVGSHMLYKAACFRRVLTGRCLPASAPVLSAGFLSHQRVSQVGIALTGLGVGLSVLLWAMDPLLLPVATSVSLLWVLWPLWCIHLLQKEPEKPEDEGRSRR
jgi:hypothetical protein